MDLLNSNKLIWIWKPFLVWFQTSREPMTISLRLVYRTGSFETANRQYGLSIPTTAPQTKSFEGNRT